LGAACNCLGTSPRAIVAVAQIDMNKGLHPAYIRDPKSYLARKEQERKAKTSRKESGRV
jgi:hypothetical protein